MLEPLVLISIAREVHPGFGGRIGLWPIFMVAKWADERMGLSRDQRENDILMLVAHAWAERDAAGKTSDALAFGRAMPHIKKVLVLVEKAIRERREVIEAEPAIRRRMRGVATTGPGRI